MSTMNTTFVDACKLLLELDDVTVAIHKRVKEIASKPFDKVEMMDIETISRLYRTHICPAQRDVSDSTKAKLRGFGVTV